MNKSRPLTIWNMRAKQTVKRKDRIGGYITDADLERSLAAELGKKQRRKENLWQTKNAANAGKSPLSRSSNSGKRQRVKTSAGSAMRKREAVAHPVRLRIHGVNLGYDERKKRRIKRSKGYQEARTIDVEKSLDRELKKLRKRKK